MTKVGLSVRAVILRSRAPTRLLFLKSRHEAEHGLLAAVRQAPLTPLHHAYLFAVKALEGKVGARAKGAKGD